MTKNQSSIFRVLLFIFGAGIIVLAFFLWKGDRELFRKDIFMWTSIGLMYLIFFLPFFFSAISIGNFSGKIPKLVIVWLGISFYIAASLTVIVLLTRFPPVISFNTAIIIQAVILFLFCISIFTAFFASTHVGKVAAEEAVKQQYIKQLKPKAQVLLLSVDKLPGEYEKAQKILKQAVEDIRFIYPVDSGAGDDLELQILKSLNIISELCNGILTGAHTVVLEGEAEKLLMLIKERKMLRN